MSLPPGARLGPYEVVSRLGAGGMGEVYRARDTRLDRIVAIKVLPHDRVSDAEARGRFEREAKAIAALSHPNICAIHDVGFDTSTSPYLVMELLEGQTLQERLLRGPLDVDQVVEYGAALADALEAAHARGLIHRDLKPANIFITSRGIPKILDFGLAKALARDDASATANEIDVTRRRDDPLTELGTTVGTVAYMSPEQLRGEPLDVRSDLFSFGIVLYEMATGQRAFAGATSAVVSAAILTREPPAPTSARPDLPPRLEETILKALEKDRNLRCQTAAELRADLTRLKRHSGSQTVRTSATTTAPSAAATITVGGERTGCGRLTRRREIQTRSLDGGRHRRRRRHSGRGLSLAVRDRCADHRSADVVSARRPRASRRRLRRPASAPPGHDRHRPTPARTGPQRQDPPASTPATTPASTTPTPSAHLRRRSRPRRRQQPYHTNRPTDPTGARASRGPGRDAGAWDRTARRSSRCSSRCRRYRLTCGPRGR